MGRSPGEENGYPLQYSCLENFMDRGAWWAIVHGVTESHMTEWLSLIYLTYMFIEILFILTKIGNNSYLFHCVNGWTVVQNYWGENLCLWTAQRRFLILFCFLLHGERGCQCLKCSVFWLWWWLHESVHTCVHIYRNAHWKKSVLPYDNLRSPLSCSAVSNSLQPIGL